MVRLHDFFFKMSDQIKSVESPFTYSFVTTLNLLGSNLTSWTVKTGNWDLSFFIQSTPLIQMDLLSTSLKEAPFLVPISATMFFEWTYLHKLLSVNLFISITRFLTLCFNTPLSLLIQCKVTWLSVNFIYSFSIGLKEIFTTCPAVAFSVAASNSALGWLIPSGTNLDRENKSWHE